MTPVMWRKEAETVEGPAQQGQKGRKIWDRDLKLGNDLLGVVTFVCRHVKLRGYKLNVRFDESA